MIFKDPAHHISNQTEIATEKLCPKRLQKNEIDFSQTRIQILHHLEIVHNVNKKRKKNGALF